MISVILQDQDESIVVELSYYLIINKNNTLTIIIVYCSINRCVSNAR